MKDTRKTFLDRFNAKTCANKDKKSVETTHTNGFTKTFETNITSMFTNKPTLLKGFTKFVITTIPGTHNDKTITIQIFRHLRLERPNPQITLRFTNSNKISSSKLSANLEPRLKPQLGSSSDFNNITQT